MRMPHGRQFPLAGTGMQVYCKAMVSVNHYRKEAARCRELAAATPTSEMASRWRSLAADYEKLADALEETGGAAAMQHAPMQHQPMQQQQSRSEPEEKP
jgi:hypothetical protein